MSYLNRRKKGLKDSGDDISSRKNSNLKHSSSITSSRGCLRSIRVLGFSMLVIILLLGFLFVGYIVIYSPLLPRTFQLGAANATSQTIWIRGLPDSSSSSFSPTHKISIVKYRESSSSSSSPSWSFSSHTRLLPPHYSGVITLRHLRPSTTYEFQVLLSKKTFTGQEGEEEEKTSELEFDPIIPSSPSSSSSSPSSSLFFTTFPDATTAQRLHPTQFSFVFGSCLQTFMWPLSSMPLVQWVLEKLELSPSSTPLASLDAPKFGVFIGDLIYSDVPFHQGAEKNYRQLFGHAWMSSLLQRLPNFMMLDDHEFSNDWDKGRRNSHYWDSIHAYDNFVGIRNPRGWDALIQEEMSKHPERSIKESFADWIRAEDLQFPGIEKQYYTFSYSDVGFFVMDTRSFRDSNKHPGESVEDIDEKGEKFMRPKSMLGRKQKRILKSWLLNSSYRVKFLVSSVVWSAHDRVGDGWRFFLNERNELFDFIVDNKIQGVVLLSGDIHVGMAFYYPTWNLYEFSASPINTFPLSCWMIDQMSIQSRDPSTSNLIPVRNLHQEQDFGGYIKFTDGEERLFCNDFSLHLGHVTVSLGKDEETSLSKNATMVYRLLSFPIGLTSWLQNVQTKIEYKITL